MPLYPCLSRCALLFQHARPSLRNALASATTRPSLRTYRTLLNPLAHSRIPPAHRRRPRPRYFCTAPPDPVTKRVLGAVAHINSGKTTTSEAMLYHSGALRRQGNVDAGDTLLDYLPAERERGITVNAAAVTFTHLAHTLFLVDSPGHLDFTYEVERALRVMDSVLVLLDAVEGVQSQTETVWRQADANALPRLVFVNKMDRDGADFPHVVRSLHASFHAAPLVLQTPLFAPGTPQFTEAFDLLRLFPDHATSHDPRNTDEHYLRLSDSQRQSVDSAAERLVQAVADLDDDIMALYLDTHPVPRPLMLAAIRRACIARKVVPVLCGASLKGIGIDALLEAIIRYLPSPLERASVFALSQTGDPVDVAPRTDAPFVAYAFKVTHDRHRGRMVHLRAFAGELDRFRTSFFNTTKGIEETPTKLLRVLADKYVEIEHISNGDIFAAVGFKKTETGDTLVLQKAPQSSRVVMERVQSPPAVFTVALQVDLSSEEKLLEAALQRLVEEDCSLETTTDDETGETLLSGMGELHLEVAVDHMSRLLKFPIRVSKPRVAYRETITASVDRPQRYDSTIGSTRFQAALQIAVKPAVTTDGNTTTADVSIDIADFSCEEASAIREGAEAALGRGPVFGAPVTRTRVSISPILADGPRGRLNVTALRACSGRAVRDALRDCKPCLLEPVMNVECVVPDTTAGDIISELSHPTRRRGTIEAIELASNDDDDDSEWNEKRKSKIRALVPLEGMIGWATKMRSITKGRGDFTATFAAYRTVDDATRKRVAGEDENK